MPDKSGNEAASPACYAGEADDAYSGYATREELIAFCNLLLEAERAGAQICARTAAEADAALRDLMLEIGKDEAACCAMLIRWIAQLGGQPSDRVGDFYGKCVAISDVAERIAFINRGQGWVVKRLREMLPKIRDDSMHAEMADMLQKHETNIARAESSLLS